MEHVRDVLLRRELKSISLVAKCPVVKVKMGGVEVKCLLDTGSMVTTITESLFKEVLQHWGAPKLKSCG